MPDYTSTWNLPYPQAAESVRPESRDFQALAVAAAAALTTARDEAIEAWATKSATAGLDADTLTQEGIWGSVSGATIANRPPGTEAGVLETRRLSTAGTQPKIQVWTSFGGNPQLWTRFYGTSWSAWTRLDGVNALRDHGFVGTTGDLNEATTPGAYGYWGTSENAPDGASGVVWVQAVNNTTNLIQLAVKYGMQPALYTRFRASAWSGWTRLDAGAVPGGGGGGGSASALKTLPVVLSASTGTATETVATGGVRFPLNINAPITRWRLHVRNFNDRTAVPYNAGASFTGLWVGPRDDGAAFVSAPTQISGPFTLPADGTEYVTAWSNAPIGDGTDMLLSLGWTGASGPNTQSPAGCYRSTSSSTAGNAAGTGYTRATSAPFSWWLEVETTATTPAVAMWGDSITTGTGNDLILYDSPLSQYCRRIGAIPVHYSYPGTGMIAWTNANTHQWTRWHDLARVDAVIHFMGQNDGFPSLAEMQSRFNDTLPHLKAHVADAVFLATLTPHSGKSEAQNTVRKAYNNWLKTLPGGARDCFDFSAAVANAANDAILPQYTSDTLHLSTAGSTKVAEAITHAIVTTGPADGFMSTVPDLDDYAAATVDATGRMSEGTRWDGTKYIPHLESNEATIAGTLTEQIADGTGYTAATVDASDRISEATLPDGTKYIPHLRVDDLEVTGSGGVTTSPVDVVILAGQSNALYRWHDTNTPFTHDEDPRLMVWNQGVGAMQTIPPTHGEDVGKGFARAYLHHNPDRRTLIVPCALGSTGFTGGPNGTWDRTEPGNLYDDMIAATQAAMTNAGTALGHVFLLWVQGEADRAVMTEAEYATAFDDLVTAARTDLAQPDMPVIVGSMTPAEIEGTDPANQGVARAHVDTPRRLHLSAYQYGPPDYNQNQQRIHYANAGRAIKGRGMFEALYRARLNLPGSSPIMPHGLAIHRSGDTVRITWEPPPCRFTAFNLEVSIDGGTWAAQAKPGPVACEANLTVDAASTIAARVSTTNETGTSHPSLIVTA